MRRSASSTSALLRGEVRVKAADGEPGPLHHVRDPRAGDPALPEEAPGRLEDRFVRLLLLLELRVHAALPAALAPAPRSKTSSVDVAEA